MKGAKPGMKKQIILFSVFLLISSLLAGQETLSKYLEIAVNNNPGLKARFSEYMASLEEVPQVGTLPDPQLLLDTLFNPLKRGMGHNVTDYHYPKCSLGLEPWALGNKLPSIDQRPNMNH